MNFKFAFCPIILLLSASLSFAQNVNVVIHGAASIAKTDDNFVCVTLDWWPAEKCDYNQCPWGKAGILNLDLRYGALINAIKAFNPLRIKVGGSLQDNVVYKVGEVSSCPNFMKREDGLFGFSQGCLSMERWDQLNRFFNHTGVKLTFGLNALFGRNESQTEKGLWIGDWQPQNTRDFMQYTISKGYKVDSYEFGNQLSGSGMGAKVDAKQYGKDVIVLKNLVKELYAHPETEPKVLGPGGFYEEKWFNTFLEVSGQGVVDGLTHHIYNLGPGDDPNMMNKVLDPSYLSQVSQTYKGVSDVVNKFRPQLGAWVSESGGALKGGSKDVSRTFADGFWYLDQMGMASTYEQKVFCRQALIGGNYGLLNATTFVPNPDYYGALLWHRLMGSTALAVTKESDPNLRVYAHCAKKKPGVSLIFINLSKDRSFNITLSNAKPGDAGKPNYEFTDSEDIPAMDPKLVDASTPISIAAQSIAYVTIRDFEAPACV
ncbi:glucuronidase 1 [Hibiscus trionum]|uniref:Glucuronidase 1 n=1 Tax=Hibiscus trionum TaxID=183268 RepID=A0A9W7GT55_HIBTR|nr:glucuronidase 1 [Hibiscus trionum]